MIKPARLTRPEEFADTYRLNVATAFNTVRAGVRPLRAAGGGSILLFGSAASTYAGWGVRVNCIAPGLVDTPLSARITASDRAREASAAMHPLGRIGLPTDIAPLAAWLLSDASEWVTGQVIGVDGGLAVARAG